MRDLATGATISFATPFNQFGSKAAIMHVLSECRPDTMTKRFAEDRHPPDAVLRVMLAVDLAVAVMLEEPTVNRAVMSWIGNGAGGNGQAWTRSMALWTLALGAGEGIPERHRRQVLECRAKQLALAIAAHCPSGLQANCLTTRSAPPRGGRRHSFDQLHPKVAVDPPDVGTFLLECRNRHSPDSGGQDAV